MSSIDVFAALPSDAPVPYLNVIVNDSAHAPVTIKHISATIDNNFFFIIYNVLDIVPFCLTKTLKTLFHIQYIHTEWIVF